ncbi:UDP-N-acetyl-D-mannosamine dehydrogenase [Alphaproteobacteria bacterium]|nr:UDP-N-acetyl-D-mannosamine dehydrogenase [Alphaproteobacteria bacterium]
MSIKSKLINVIGLGYIGLPTAALLASQGYKVVGTDINQSIVETINQGKIHIIEPDLDVLVEKAISTDHLKASTSYQAADVYIICVPTPFHETNPIPQPNIDNVIAATRNIANLIKPGDLVILESTSPIGTTEKMQMVLEEIGAPINDIHIAYCPERVLPGNTISELVENDRIVGGLTPTATKTVSDFFRTFVNGKVLETDAKTAEMCKLTENSFRDVNIAFANEISMICSKEGINVWNMVKLANHHPRVNILQPSAGVGGHCIAVDPWFIIANNEKNARLLLTAREVNTFKTDWVIDNIKLAATKATKKSGKKSTIACLGLAFKPDIGDLRESPALKIALLLASQGHDVITVEPNIKFHESLTVVKLEQAIHQADVIAVLVKHKDFVSSSVLQNLSNKSILDFCGALQKP